MKLLSMTAMDLFFVAAIAAAYDPTPIADAERAFSKFAGEKGTRRAFLTFMAEDGVVFQNGPIPARAFYEGRPEGGGVLFWQPEVVEISKSGDFGYSTGP